MSTENDNARMNDEYTDTAEAQRRQRQEALFESTLEMAEWAYECWKEAVADGADSSARVYAETFAKLRALPMPWYYPGAVAV